MQILPWIIATIGAYIAGSIPFGVIIGRTRGVDIREHGSGNVGATNVTRILGKRLGVTCFALDVLKGALPVLFAGAYFDLLGRPVFNAGPDQASITPTMIGMWLMIAIASILGHMFSIFLGFSGGKGVATGFGSMVAMWNLLTFPALAALIVWIVVVRVTRFVSLASICAAGSLPIWCMLLMIPRTIGSEPLVTSIEKWSNGWPLYALTMLIGIVVFWKHRGNLSRIRAGTEPKTGDPTNARA